MVNRGDIEFPIRSLHQDQEDILQNCDNLINTFKPLNEIMDTQEHDEAAGVTNLQNKMQNARAKVNGNKNQSSLDEDDLNGSADSEGSENKMNDKKNCKTVEMIPQLIDPYSSVTAADTQYNPEDFLWEVLKLWRESNVKYQDMRDIGGYINADVSSSFKTEDEYGFHRDLVLQI